MKELIQKLVQTPSPSGHESQVREVIHSEIASLVDELRVDALGNLIAHKGQGGAKIMLAAHMDEIGLIVTHIDENGFVRFLPVGGVRVTTLNGARVRFLNGAVGVIGMERLENTSKMPEINHFFIDLGLRSRAECSLKVGDMAVFDRELIDLGSRLAAKSMDDRIGVAVMIEVLRELASRTNPHDLYFVFTTQEEVGTRGAGAAAYSIAPDLAIAIDVTAVGDTPKGTKMDVSLGKGPAIKVRDQGMLSDPRIVDWMATAAQEAGVPYQLEVLELGSTDARPIQITRAGVPAGCLSIPTRYVHSPSELVDWNDVQNSVRLLIELLTRPLPAELQV